MYKYIPGHFLFLWLEIILLIINVISLMQKSEVMYNRATVITDRSKVSIIPCNLCIIDIQPFDGWL